MSASLVTLLTSLHQAMGRVEAGHTGIHQRIADLKEEVFYRFTRTDATILRLHERLHRIETGTTESSTELARHIPWPIIIKATGYLLAGIMMATAHLYAPELKQLIGFSQHQQP